jgi:uncharacterized membrane protein
VLGLAILAATATALAPRPVAWRAADDEAGAAGFAQVRQIVAARCVPCHAANPTEPGVAAAPQGLMLDTPEALVAHAAMLGPMVETRAMPLGNVTGMTDPERRELLDWIRRGAPH